MATETPEEKSKMQGEKHRKNKDFFVQEFEKGRFLSEKCKKILREKHLFYADRRNILTVLRRFIQFMGWKPG